MKIYNSLEHPDIGRFAEDGSAVKTAVALGNFDGLHIGHHVVMEDAVRTAKERDMLSLCFTFSNHPFNYILQRSDDDPDAVRLICTEGEKEQLIRDMGFDILVNIPFDETVMTMKAQTFFDDIILAKLNAGYVSAGFNYTYGARAEGKPPLLIRQCEAAGIEAKIHDEVSVDGRTVSSTLIREMIAAGNMEMTARYLGRPYSFEGRVCHGKKLGSRMGIPTVNIPVPARQMLPPSGVYYSRIKLDGTVYCSISNIGINPTLNDPGKAVSEKRIETFIFDFDSDIYGSDVTVYFDHYARAERRFGSKEELFAQIASDCEDAKRFHATIHRSADMDMY